MWTKHKQLGFTPSFGKLSFWERLSKWFDKSPLRPDWAPWRKGTKKPEMQIEGVKRLIEEDAREIFTKHYGIPEFNPEFMRSKLKALGWTDEAIDQLGQKVTR